MNIRLSRSTNCVVRLGGEDELGRLARRMTPFLATVLFASLSIAAATAAPLPGARGEDGVRRLSPSAFLDIPAWLVSALNSASCEIPQFGLERRANNIVAGRFIKASRIDWAAICSSEGTSKILIFSRVQSVPVNVLSLGRDKQGLYDTGYGFEYGTDVWRISASAARTAARRFDERLPDSVRTAGILIGKSESAASALFFHQGKWIEVPTAD